MPEQSRRGFVPRDTVDFGEEALPQLKKAAQEVLYLIGRGYPMMSAARFVGDHYQFTERQRLAVARTVSPEKSVESRKSREVTDLSGRTVFIDGFNIIISLEIAFSRSTLFRCMDGTVRDLAGLHGTYRIIPQTDTAIKALFTAFGELKIQKAVIYLDKPVSNSGRLKKRIYDLGENTGTEFEVILEDQVDTLLKSKPLIASADAIILDECAEWFNLVKYIIDTQIGDYPFVDITP